MQITIIIIMIMMIIMILLEILGEAVIRNRIIIIRINQIIKGSNHYSSSGSLFTRQLRVLTWIYTSFGVA